MKIAWIDHQFMHHPKFKTDIEGNGIELYGEINIGEFERCYGKIDDFDGALLHPGISMQNYYITDFPKQYPTLPFAFVTNVPTDYRKENIPVFSYSSIDEIIEFFRSNLGARGN